MKVYVFPADMAACGHYRLMWPAEILQDHGWDIVIVEPRNRDTTIRAAFTGMQGTRDVQVTEVFIPDDADVIVFQRVSNIMLVQAIPFIRAKGVAVVVDVDDDLSALDPSNPAFRTMHPTHGKPDHSWHNVVAACEMATLVQVSTDALVRRYGRRGNARVVRNCVPERYLQVMHEDSDVVGWAAGLQSHWKDAEVLGTSMARLQRDGVAYGHIGSPMSLVREKLNLDELPLNMGTPDLAGYPEAVTKLGVGLAPLSDTLFNRSKSWLKPLEYAALGVPCVMSPRVEYARIHKMGVGLLAKTDRDWFAKTKRLVRDEALRRELSARGREVASELTYQKQAHLWGDIWAEACQLERGVPIG